MHAKGFWKVEVSVLLAIFLICIVWNREVRSAGPEHVEIINVETSTQLVCSDATSHGEAAAPTGIAGTNITPGQAVATLGGAAAGAFLGGSLAGSKHRTTGQVVGGIAGAAAGYGLTTPSKPVSTTRCIQKPVYITTYKRKNGTSGQLFMQSRTTAKTMVINFCPGEQGQLERPC